MALRPMVWVPVLLGLALLASGCTQTSPLPPASASSSPPGGVSSSSPAATGAAIKPATESASAAKVAAWVKDLAVEPSVHFGGMDAPSYQALTEQVQGLRATVLEKGTTGLYADTALLQRALNALEEKFDDDYRFTAAAGMKYVRSEPGPWVWNLVEPEKGKGYRWEFPDLHVKMARKYGLDPIVTIRHFSAWDTAACGKAASGQTAEVVKRGSFWYLGGYFGPVCNLDDFARWLEAVAERYDGDGKDDMPGLGGRGLKLWEIFNEVQGPDGGYYQKGAEYGKVVKRASEVIKKHCPDCAVSNDGAFDVSLPDPNTNIKGWFRDAFGAGMANAIDALNWHWNIERNEVRDESEYRKGLDGANDMMKGAGVSKPQWITEIGTFAGTSQSGGGVFMGQGSTGSPSGGSPGGGPSGGSQTGGGAGKCGDGTCDSIEKQTGGCPQDCTAGTRTAIACGIPVCTAAGPALLLSLPGVQAQPPGGGKCGDGTCDSIEKQTGGCPVDCGGSLGSPPPGGSGSGGQTTPGGSSPQGGMQGGPQPGGMQEGQAPGGRIGSQPGGTIQSEEEQAAWYVRRYGVGFAKGATLFTPDTMGIPAEKGMGGVGTGSLVYRDSPGSPVGARLLFYVHKLLVAKLGKFTAAEETGKGQVKFTVDGKMVYLLWDPSKSSAPVAAPSLTGRWKVTDLYGNERTVEASQLSLSATPVFAEPA